MITDIRRKYMTGKGKFVNITYNYKGYGINKTVLFLIFFIGILLMSSLLFTLTNVLGQHFLLRIIVMIIMLILSMRLIFKYGKPIYKNYLRETDILNLLNDFIWNNNLVLQKSDITDSEVEKTKIIRSVKLGYNLDGQYLTIRAYNRADVFSEKIEKLEHLEAALGMSITKKIVTSNYVDYYFSLKPVKRFTVEDTMNKDLKDQDIIIINDDISWKINKPNNIAITGLSGSGKTYYANNILLQIASLRKKNKDTGKEEAPELYFVDGKQADISIIGLAYEQATGKKDRTATSLNQIAKVLRLLNDEMELRYKEMFEDLEDAKRNFGKTANECGYNDYVLVVDEWASISAMGKKDKESKKVINEINAYLTNLVLKGRQSSIGVILISQRLDAELFETSAIRESFQIRCLLGSFTNDSARMMFNTTEELTQPTDIGQGYITIEGKINEPTSFKTPFYPKGYDFLEEFHKALK